MSNFLPPTAYCDDDAFDRYLPLAERRLSKVHWSPLAVIGKAAAFLARNPGGKIIDVGSGTGKFCIGAARNHPLSDFYGIELREGLHRSALELKTRSGLENVHFMHGNFTEFDFGHFTGIYFFNSFAEHICPFDRIDSSVPHSSLLYTHYSSHLYQILEEMPSGTRLASYYVCENEIPLCYELAEKHFRDNLGLWVRR